MTNILIYILVKDKDFILFIFQAEGDSDPARSPRSPSRNSQKSNISVLSTVSTPVTPGRRGRGDTTPTPVRKESVRSRRGSSVSGSQTPTPRNSGFLEKEIVEAEANGSVVNGEAGDIKHKVNGNSSTSPLKSKHDADGSNNNDMDSIPCGV